MIGAVTVFNALLGFAQVHRAERALRALKRIGCLEHCEKSADCPNGESCIESACAMRCG